MNIYVSQQPFTSVFGVLTAKSTVICRKTQCVLVLNATRFGAKCSAFWCKMQGKMVLNAVQKGAKYKVKSIKMHDNGINKTFYNH